MLIRDSEQIMPALVHTLLPAQSHRRDQRMVGCKRLNRTDFVNRYRPKINHLQKCVNVLSNQHWSYHFFVNLFMSVEWPFH